MEKMRFYLISVVWLCVANFSFSHSLNLSFYSSPVSYDISLAGNFHYDLLQ